MSLRKCHVMAAAITLSMQSLPFASTAQAQFVCAGSATGAAPLSGGGASATAAGSTACGTSAQATAGNSSALGYNAQATAPSATAVGSGALATGNYSTALGFAWASGTNAIASGDGAQAAGDNASAYGASASASQFRSTAIGADAEASGSGSVALGFAQATGNQTTAAGFQSQATGGGATSYGAAARATGDLSSAFGNSTTASHANSSAFGTGATTTRDNQQMFGTSTNTYTMAGIASDASRAAQGAPTGIVTSNANGDLAVYSASALGFATADDVRGLRNEDKRLRQGIAMAAAIPAAIALPGEKFSMSVDWGNYRDTNAMGMSGAMSLGKLDVGAGSIAAQVHGGISYAGSDSVVAKAGVRFGW